MTASFMQLPSVHGLDSGPLGPYVQPYITLLQEQGYQPDTIRVHLRLFTKFSRWLVRSRRTLFALNEAVLEDFLKRHLGRRKGWARRQAGLLRLLGILRAAGVASPAKLVLPTPAQILANRYRRYLLEARGCSERTVENYARHIDRFVVQCFGAGPAKPSVLQAREIVEFVRRNAREHSPQHTKQVISGLRSFLRYLHYGGDVDTDLSSAVPGVAHWRLTNLPKHLPPAAVQLVLNACDQTTAIGLRNYAVLLLLARLGLRAGEIVILRLEDIDWDNARLLIRSRKGPGLARMPLPAEVGKALARYLKEARPRCSCRNVFVRTVAPYGPISNSVTISGLARKAIQKAGVSAPRTGAHVFRHSLATAMLRHGASLDEIGQVLRHQDPDTTAIYAKVDLDALRPLALAWPGGVR